MTEQKSKTVTTEPEHVGNTDSARVTVLHNVSSVTVSLTVTTETTTSEWSTPTEKKQRENSEQIKIQQNSTTTT